jgi:hypothetical protein
MAARKPNAHRGASAFTGRRALPPEMTRNQVAGFTAAMSKETLGGGMGKVMAMARSHLRNVPRL